MYAYRCTQCGHRFEKIQNFSAEPEHECPKCHGVLERPLTAPRLNFKGAGWYVNDYAPKGSTSEGCSSSSDSGSESYSKSDSKEGKSSSEGSSATASPKTAAGPSSSAPSTPSSTAS